MLIDNWTRLTAISHRASPTGTDLIGLHRHNAQRFQFTDEVTRMAAGMCRDYPNLLVHNYQFATPPYETTYIEYNAIVWATEFGIRNYKGGGSTEEMDEVVGHFIYRDVVATVTAGKPLTSAAVMPWLYTFDWFSEFATPNYQLGKHSILPVIITHGDDPALPMAAQILGSILHSEHTRINHEIVEHIYNHSCLWMERHIGEKIAQSMLPNFVGEVRNLWQLLLFIHQPHHLIFDDIPARRSMVGNKSIAHPKYRLVRIKPKTTMHHISRTFTERLKPGLHDVRAFWRNFDKNDICVHEWPLLPNDMGQFHCAKCSQWRVRVQEHKRGDPNRPVVRKGYKV